MVENALKNTMRTPGERTWMLVFAFTFLALLVDGADLMFLSYSLSSLKKEFDLTSVQAGSLGTVTLIGMAVGGIWGGWAADKFGRVRVTVWCIMVFSVGTAILGMTQDYLQFAAARFFASIGLGAVYVVGNTLMAEYVPTKHRTTVLGSLQAGWSVGYLVATLLAGWILPAYGWRWLFYIAILPVIMAVMMRRLVPEPPNWVAARARLAAGETDDTSKPAEESSSLKLIFGNPLHRKMFILWSFTAGFLQFGYYGVNNWMPTYLENELHINFKAMAGYMVGTYIAMILGKILAGWLADVFGRRAIFAIGALGTALFLPVIVWYNTPENIIYLLIFFGFLYGIPYGVNATYMTESFETKIRGSAVGGAYNVGRVGAALGPVVIGYLATNGSIGTGFLMLGVAYFFCGMIPALFIKEKLYDAQQ